MVLHQTFSATSRQTKYVTAVREALKTLDHATNSQILDAVQRTYPEAGITTIHRVTARLKARDIIACAPKHIDGSERYDANTTPHHHFMCTNCGALCDIPDSDEAKHAVSQIQNLSEQCKLAGMLTLQGTCVTCTTLNQEGEK